MAEVTIRTTAGTVPPLAGHPPIASSLLIDLYRLLLFVLMLAYFLAIIFVVSELVNFSLLMLSPTVLSTPLLVVAYGVYLSLAMPFIGTMIRLLIKGVVGLVTDVNDHDPDGASADLLPRQKYQSLYQMVANVARRVHAPVPDEVRVTHRAECYVTEHRSFSVITARRLVLVLGMPQLTVLTPDELRVTLAHELAHFRRGDTSLGVFIFRFLESLKQSLRELRASPWCWINPLFPFTRLYQYFFLWMSAPIRRQQELRADALSAAAYGGELAAHTLLKEWLLAHQFDAAVASYLVEETQNPLDHDQNVFNWFGNVWRSLSPEGQDYLERRLAQEERPSFWDSHPSIAARLKTMRAFPARPTGDCKSVSELVADFSALQHRLQERLYRAH